MKRKRFSVEQIVAVLKQAELGMAVSDLTRQMGISEQTFYRWKKQYAGLQSDQVRELKQLQDENTRLKKLVADLSLDKAILQDINQKMYDPPRVCKGFFGGCGLSVYVNVSGLCWVMVNPLAMMEIRACQAS